MGFTDVQQTSRDWRVEVLGIVVSPPQRLTRPLWTGSGSMWELSGVETRKKRHHWTKRDEHAYYARAQTGNYPSWAWTVRGKC